MHLNQRLKALIVLTLAYFLAFTPAVVYGQTLVTTASVNVATAIISASHSGTLYLGLSTGISNATETNVQQVMSAPGTASNLYVVATAPGGSDTIAVTVDKNTTAQTLTCTVSAAGTTCNDTTHSFTWAAGDLLSIKAVYSTAVTGAVTVGMTLTYTGATTGTVNNHTLFTGSTPTLSVCGTSPSNTNSTDNAGLITLGSGTVTGCTETFATAFTNIPRCTVQTDSNASTVWISAVSTTAVTFTLNQTGAAHLYYSCF